MGSLENKKALYIGGFELPDKNAAAQRVIANAKILSSLGYSVVFIGIDKTMKIKEPILNTKTVFEGFIYYKIKYPETIFEWITNLTSIKYIKELADVEPALIIAYNYPSIALMKLKSYCNRKGILLIADCTEWYEAKGNIVHKIIKGFDVYLRMRILHTKLDGLVVISEYLFNFYKTKTRNLLRLPPLVDLSMNKWRINNKLNEDNKIVLIYAGSPGSGEKDRIDKIIKVLSDIKENAHLPFIFKIIGLTKIEFLKSFEDETLPLNIDEFASFKGRLSHTDTLKEISSSDYQLFIRDKNLANKAGFPTKYVESISCGTPVLTNSSSNIESYFVSGKNGFLLDISSEEHLTSSLLKAMSMHKEQIKQMKSYCKSSLLFNYTNYILPFKDFLYKLGK